MRLGLVLATLVLAVTGCGGDEPAEPQRAVDQGSEPAVDELAAHDGKPCPPTLPNELGTDPATRLPHLAEPDRAWVCAYGLGDDPDSWPQAGKAVEVPQDDLAGLMEAVDALVPVRKDRMCSADLGPRFMLVTEREGDLTGIVVENYGCRDTRMTDEPWTTVPGEATGPGTVKGVLDGADLMLRIEAALDLPR